MGTVRRQKVDTFIEHLYCDDCEDVKMVWNHMELTSDPAQYPHTCPECGKTENIMGEKYPQTVQCYTKSKG
jgi:hypothetical protein